MNSDTKIDTKALESNIQHKCRVSETQVLMFVPDIQEIVF
jgi:hypothetical protein